MLKASATMEPAFLPKQNPVTNKVPQDIKHHDQNTQKHGHITPPSASVPSIQDNGNREPDKPDSDKANDNDASGSGEPARRKTYFVMSCIIVTGLCETLIYFSVLANMVLYCTTRLKMSTSDAAVVTLVFSGSVNIMPVFGGFVADAWLGKFNTILLACLINILGLFSLTASAVHYKRIFGSKHDITLDGRKGCFFTALVFIVIGTGGIKANLGPFGAQQIEYLGTGAVRSFFNWFYWFRNVGGIIAYTAVAYVQQERGFDYGYLIILVCMILTALVFIAARTRYSDPGPEGSVLGKAVGFCIASVSGFKYIQDEPTESYEDRVISDIKVIIRLLPIFGPFVVYWAVYAQMSTSLFLQSARMDISIGDSKLPAAMLNSFNAVFVLVLIPVMDRVVYPFLERRGRSPTHFQRIGFGMILAVFAMLYAGILEIVRKDDMSSNGCVQQTLSGEHFNASKISMFAQIPEFALIGTSEVFTAISGLEFAYTQAPASMQGLIMGVFLLTTGLGNYLASLIVAIVKSWRTSDASDWYPADPNRGRLEYMLFLLTALTFIDMLLFIAVARWYKRKRLRLLEDSDSGGYDGT